MQHRNHDSLVGERFRDRASGTAHHHVFFDSHECVVLAREPHDERRVERFDEPHVRNGRIEFLGRRKRVAQHGAEREDRDAVPAPCANAADLAAADRNRGHLARHGCARPRPARIANGRRRIEGEARVEHLAAFILVGGRHYRHVRHAAQVRKIEGAEVRRAVGADDARAIDREDDRQVLQRDVVDQLVVGALQEG